MSEKIINMHHKVCDYTCMWNGMEDLYERRTGEEVPDYFFFCLSGIGNFVYMKFSKGELRRLVGWGDGRTKKMYQSICETVGFTYKHIEGKSFEYTMKKAKEQIDQDNPVILGCLDMCYLEYYPKFYYKVHIPIHYILMVGYDDEKQCVYVQDCGLPGIQKVTYSDLEKALGIKKSELSDKNTICFVDFSDYVKSIREIAINGFLAKAKAMLEPQVGFTGIPGMRKLAGDFHNWQEQLSDLEYRTALTNIVEFSGTVPLLPAKLRGEGDKDYIKYCGLRDRLGNLIIDLGMKYDLVGWDRAGKLFLQSGEIIQNITEMIVEFLLGNRQNLNELPDMINRIADLEKEAYTSINSVF